LRDCAEKSITGRNKIVVGAARRYYEKLYCNKQNYENIEGTNVDSILGFKGGVDNNAQPFARIIRSEIRDVLKNLKVGKVSGPDTIENEFMKLFLEEILTPPHPSSTI